MKYISIDLETTGLDPSINQIIEFGAVLEDTKRQIPLDDLPTFHAYITHPRGMLTGNVYALDLNADIINKIKNKKELKNKYNFIKVEHLAHDFLFWLFSNGFELKVKNENTPDEYRYSETFNVAGKNFSSFDKLFLEKVPEFSKLIRIRRRILDPAILCVDWENDESLPSLSECNKRTGFMNDVTHKAVDDAKDVIRILRHQYI